MKRRTIIITGLLVCVAFLAGCTLRPSGSPVPAATAEPTSAPEPEVTEYTVTWRLNGEILASEQVAEGDCPTKAPALSGERAITRWTADGEEADVWNTPVTSDRVYDGVTGPKLHLRGGFISGESDLLFHPFEPFTRSDAARAVYAVLSDKPTGETFLKDVTTRAKCWNAATALVTGGYMTIDENGRFYPDVPITREDLTALLEKMFSPGAVRAALENKGEPITRGEAAEL
ncbi:MAG: S-layer homology domain-containing protein, partial [Oscillospiraceae bacterium]|nr:S-layer homology domain-containing protein [Oscillospiraceae bacterium]